MTTLVLIVDDEAGLAEVTADTLASLGYDVRVAVDGLHGLEALAQARADVVLVDVMMPIMSGPEMIHAMRATAELADIPVILMTGMAALVPTGADALHDHLLMKPFNRSQLLAALDRYVARPER